MIICCTEECGVDQLKSDKNDSSLTVTHSYTALPGCTPFYIPSPSEVT